MKNKLQIYNDLTDLYKYEKFKNYTVMFETNLNACIKIDVTAIDWEDAIQQVLIKFPGAFNFS